MTKKEIFSNLFVDEKIDDLDSRFQLKDFNFMMTSQRTVDKIFKKLEKIKNENVEEDEHGNFWPDLRTMGLTKIDENAISKFGEKTYEYFQNESDDFKREHFILSNIRKKSWDIPSEVQDNYFKKIKNLEDYLSIIPELNNGENAILNNTSKLFFTECLNTFPNALKNYFTLSPEDQKELDNLHESGLINLFDSSIEGEGNLVKITNRFKNVCRAFDRRTNFIKSVILSEYEELEGQRTLERLLKFEKILNSQLLNEIIKNIPLDEITINEDSKESPYWVSSGAWKNWEHTLNNHPIRWGVKEKEKNLWEKLQIDDIVFCSCSSKSERPFTKNGMFMVGRVSKKYELVVNDGYYPESLENGEGFFKYRFELEPIKVISTDDKILPFPPNLAVRKSINHVTNVEVIKELLKNLEEQWDVKLDSTQSHYLEVHPKDQAVNEVPETQHITPGKLQIPTKEQVEKGIKEIQKELLIDDSIIEEIITHLASGRHVLLAGPVGTGKTKLSQLIPGIFWTENNGYFGDVRTATSDWTTQDVIGGISPKISKDPNHSITYEIDNGCVTDTILENYEKESRKTENTIRHTSIHKVNDEKKQFHGTWLVIDEFNRADIDKAFGQLFTALEYGVLKIQDINTDKAVRSIKIPKDYRIIGTLNTADRHYLFPLSDALKRRFAYVEISIPDKKDKEREIFLAAKNALKDLDKEKLKDIIKIEDKSDSFDSISDSLKEKLEYAYEVLKLIRPFKPLGTAVLKLIYQNIIVAEKIGLSTSLDNAINANLIPQLETLPKPTLHVLYQYLFGKLSNFLDKDAQKEQYKTGFEAILRYLDYSVGDIKTKSDEWINTGNYENQIKEKILTSLESQNDSFKNLTLFKNSLDEILKNTEF
jgi:MoxR-like ATPase